MARFNKIQDNNNDDFDAELFKKAINHVEASGNRGAYTLESPTSNAVGPYQIIVRFANDEKKKLKDIYKEGETFKYLGEEYNLTKSEFNKFLNKLTDNVHAKQLRKKYGITSKEQFKNNPKTQEKYMDWLITSEYPKQIKSLQRDYGPGGQNLTRNAIKDFSREGLIGDLSYYDLMALEHFQGHPNAREYFASLREGRDFTVPGEVNKTIPEYLNAFRSIYSPSSQIDEEQEGPPFMPTDTVQENLMGPLPRFME